MIAFLSNLIILYPIAFSLFLALQFSEANADGRKVTIGVQFVRSTVLIMFTFVVIAIGCRVSVLSLLWVIIFGVMGVLLLFRQARLNRSAVTMTVLACEDRPQIQRAVAYFAEENGGMLGRRLQLLRRYLAQDIPWSQAIEFTGFCSRSYERLVARLTERFGRATQLTDELYGPLQIEIELERMLARLSVLTWICLFGPVFFFYRLMILPIFLRMLTEFDVAIPDALQLMREGGTVNMIATIGSSIALVAFGIAALIWMFPVLSLYYPFRWLCGPYFRCLGFVAFARVSQRIPLLIDTCGVTAEMLPVAHVAKRFRRVAEAIGLGHPPADALALAGLIKSDRGGEFASILQTTGVAWAARQLAESEIQLMLNRYSLAIQVLVVAFSLLFGLLVGLIAFGLIQALAIMIQSLA